MYTIISIILIILVSLIGIFIYRLIKKAIKWTHWKRDIRVMSNNYIYYRTSIHESNNFLIKLYESYKNENNTQEKTRLRKLATKQYNKGEVLSMEHDMIHTTTYNEIKEKYIKN